MKYKKVFVPVSVDGKFGDWTVIRHEGTDRHKANLYLCKCICGVTRIVVGQNLKNGRSKGCGCSKGSKITKANTTHGYAKNKNGEYRIWANMIQRCINPKKEEYSMYGGRGIKVCERWLSSFENFLSDVGSRPSNEHSIDRFPDMNGDYEPKNVRWATRSEQFRNMRTNRWIDDGNGKKLILADWSRELSIPEGTLSGYLNKGMTIPEIITKNQKA